MTQTTTLSIIIGIALLSPIPIQSFFFFLPSLLLPTSHRSSILYYDTFHHRRRRRQRQTLYSVDDKEIYPSEEEELDEILQVAIDASKKAGAIILHNSNGVEVSERKANNRDLLTLIDPLCEKTIRETILSKYPHHNFLGEEDVPPGKEASIEAIQSKLKSSSSSDYLWIVDPIDGTSNFVHGMPLCMPSIALAQKNKHNQKGGTVLIGVIYDPHRDELFTARKGHGAFLNGQPIRVNKEQMMMSDAIVGMGSPPGHESLQMSLLGIKELMPKVRTIRMLGSAALMLAWVACGRLTCYWEYDLSSWDVAAGSLLVDEAGGRYGDLDGNIGFDLLSRKMIASNGLVHYEILDVLNDAGVV